MLRTPNEDAPRRRIVIKSEEERIVFAEVYSPLHVDTDGEAMTPTEIRKMAHKFLSEGRVKKIDVQHSQKESGCSVVESFIAREHDPDGFIQDSWVMAVHIPQDEVWEEVKSGKLNGFSFFGEVRKIPAKARVAVTRKMEGVTEDSMDGPLPPHEHDVLLMFDQNGRLMSGKTEETLNHVHEIKRATATELEWEHAHRMIMIEN